jgi:glycosyltransferase involved in cell wall biosynthesis
MRVVVSVQGRFHGFDLAAQLHAYGALLRLMSSQPAFRAAKWGVPRERVRTLLRYEAAQRLAARAGLLDRIPHFVHWTNEAFDRAVARRIEPADVVVAWSGMALHTLRRARALGARTVVERGSAHIEAQRDLLEEERRRFALPPAAAVDPWAIEKELREYEEADAIAIPSSFVRRTFVARGVPERKLIQVPYGVDLRAFRPGTRTLPGFRAIYAGALSLRKGIPDLLEAARRASVELWLVGPRSSEVEPFLRRDERGVRWHAPVPQARLPELYREADVFVLASVEEGFGMVIRQALACGLPVVCTDHTAGDDVVRDGVNGFVVPIRDPDAIAARLAALRDDPARLAAMKRAALESAAEDSSWNAYGLATIAAYRSLLAQSAGRR